MITKKNYNKLEWIHCAIQEALKGNKSDLKQALEYVEDIREDYFNSKKGGNMGWWPMGKNGGIAGLLDEPREGQDPIGAIGTFNQIPGKDDPKDLYMGDGPADEMGDALDQMYELFIEDFGRKPTFKELAAYFTSDEDNKYTKIAKQAVIDVNAEYQEAWCRDATDDEMAGCIRFTSGHLELEE